MVFIMKIDKHMSKEIVSSSGVPQGSNIGPLLFILFINDVTLALPPDSISLFADDAKIFAPIHNTVTVHSCKTASKFSVRGASVTD